MMLNTDLPHIHSADTLRLFTFYNLIGVLWEIKSSVLRLTEWLLWCVNLLLVSFRFLAVNVCMWHFQIWMPLFRKSRLLIYIMNFEPSCVASYVWSCLHSHWGSPREESPIKLGHLDQPCKANEFEMCWVATWGMQRWPHTNVRQLHSHTEDSRGVSLSLVIVYCTYGFHEDYNKTCFLITQQEKSSK